MKTKFQKSKIFNYQKAVKLKKLGVVVMEAIDPAAKMNCAILRAKPRTVPGVPGKSFIFLSKTSKYLRFLTAKDEHPPSSDLS